jgi:hypothetical protein
MANKGLAGILEKILIGSSLIFGGNYISELSGTNYLGAQQRTSQKPSTIDPVANLVVGHMLHHVPTKNPRDAQGLRMIGDANIAIGLMYLNSNHVRNESFRNFGGGSNYRSGNPANRNVQRDVSRTFLCNYYKDFNNNGRLESEEFIGTDKKIFRKNESLAIGMYVNARESIGKTGYFKIFNPKGEEFFSGPEDAFKYVPVTRGGHFSPGEFIKAHGAGTYVAVFYYDDKFWEARSFELVE